MSCGDIFLGVIAIFFPPVAVWIKSGLCSADSLINILLCMLGYIPGLIHAWYIIAKYPEHDHDYDPIDNAEAGRGGRITYYYVSHEGTQRPLHQHQHQHNQQRTYGTQQSGTTTTNKSVTATQWQGQQQDGTVAGSSRQPQQPARSSEGAGSHEAGAPPSYSDVVKGDNKIQRQN